MSTLAGVPGETMATADTPADATAAILSRLDQIDARLDVMAKQVEAADAARAKWAELLGELTSLSGAGMARLTDVVATAEEQGYFTFARGTAAIADRVVTSYDEADVAALGDNVVTILDAMKEVTAPEVMALVHRAARTLQDSADTPTPPPSALALLRSMRDPQARRGLGRLVAMLHALGDEQHANPDSGALSLDHRRPDTPRAGSTR